MKIKLKRIFRSGLLNFKRNWLLSTVTALVMFLTVSLATSLFLFKGAADFMIFSLENKVDMAVYFTPDALEEEILKVRDLLLEIEGVSQATYVSADEALAQFKERHQTNGAVKEALEEVGDNPFLPSLSVRAKDFTDYQKVNEFLKAERFSGLIGKIDFLERQVMLEKFYSLRNMVQILLWLAIMIFSLIAAAITFSTIRLTIYGAGEEINIMRLVGASNWFIRGPFLVQGLICGLLAILLALPLFLILSFAVSPAIFNLTGGFNQFKYFIGHLPLIVLIQLLVGVGLGLISGLVAVGRYLKK